MPNKFKNRVRERMERTGESYTTAKRNMEDASTPLIHRPGALPSFASVVSQVITLAQARDAEYEAHPGNHARWAPESRLAEKALRDLLLSLPRKTLNLVQTVMYVGRDKEDLLAMDKHLHSARNTPPFAVAHQISSKMPLVEYLRDGLREASRQGVNLEQFESTVGANGG